MTKKRFHSLQDYIERVETQVELARRTELSQPTISRALRGKGSLWILKRIADATGVPLDSFQPHKRKDVA